VTRESSRASSADCVDPSISDAEESGSPTLAGRRVRTCVRDARQRRERCARHAERSTSRLTNPQLPRETRAKAATLWFYVRATHTHETSEARRGSGDMVRIAFSARRKAWHVMLLGSQTCKPAYLLRRHPPPAARPEGVHKPKKHKVQH
jgi:hypothetical protein